MLQWVGNVVDGIVNGIKAMPGVLKRRRQRKILLAMLRHDDYKWRKLSTLAKAIGETGPEGEARSGIFSSPLGRAPR